MRADPEFLIAAPESKMVGAFNNGQQIRPFVFAGSF